MNGLRCPIVELRQYTLRPGQRDVQVPGALRTPREPPHFGTSPISAAILTGVLALPVGSTRMVVRKAESNADRRTKPAGSSRGLGVAAAGGTG